MGFKARQRVEVKDLWHVWEKPPNYIGDLLRCRYCPAKTFPQTRWSADGPCPNRAAIERLGSRQRALLGRLYKQPQAPSALPQPMRRLVLRLRKLGLVKLSARTVTSDGLFTAQICELVLTDIGREALKEKRP